MNLLEIYAVTGVQQGFMGISLTYWLLMGVTMLVSMWVSSTMQRRFAEYSQIPISMSGAEVARMMLQQNGISDVKVESVAGHLTDHYDPTTKTVNLSEPVFHANSVAAAAVAAHECGHAVQHQQAYIWLGLRSKLVPAVNLSSKLLNVVMILGFVGIGVFHSDLMLRVWIGLFAVTTLFAVVTLPVEFDASRRALAWLDRSGLSNRMEQGRARNALFWAAMTYVVAALGSVAQLLYYVSMLSGRRE